MSLIATLNKKNINELSAQRVLIARPMQAYLDWKYGLVDQLEKDGTHGFYVI